MLVLSVTISFDPSTCEAPLLTSIYITRPADGVQSKSFHPSIPHTSSPTHSNATVSPCLRPRFEHKGSFAKVGHQAEEPSRSVSSKYKPYLPSLKVVCEWRVQVSQSAKNHSPTTKGYVLGLTERHVIVLPCPFVDMYGVL